MLPSFNGNDRMYYFHAHKCMKETKLYTKRDGFIKTDRICC